MGWGFTILLFGGASLLLVLATHFIIPLLHRLTGIEVILLWFLVGALLVFVALFVTAFVLIGAELGLEWIANAVGWALFHLAFGWQLLLLLLPILIILPYIVHRRRNTWIGVLLHAGLNGPAFVAIALGLIP
jgi:hypothetical protein